MEAGQVVRSGAGLLAAERKGASFPVRDLTLLLDPATPRRENFRALVAKDREFDNRDQHFRNRTERYQHALGLVKHLHLYKTKLGLNQTDMRLLTEEALTEFLPTLLHEIAFVPFIRSQASPEQAQKWLPLAEQYRIIGAYAQTELGHGSNVQGLETTATFVPETDEFELHTPTLTATKWWPGCMGKTATHVVAMAQLIIHGKRVGVHAFIVPIRSLENHMPLPGVTVGDIGPKLGTDSNDNGYLRLDHVRVPRDHMLMGFAKVDREGRYSKPAHDKIAYFGMLYIRASLVEEASRTLSKAVTIAIRYSAVRCQFAPGKGEPEKQVIDYRMQQYRVFPYLAAAYALKFTGRYMRKLFDELAQGITSGNLSSLPEVHATSSGLKSLTTTITAEGIEVCRRACGGHGYTHSSGLGSLFADYVGVLTAEGENFLLTQQTGRYLLKAYEKLRRGSAASSAEPKIKYLENVDDLLQAKCSAKSAEDFLCPQRQLHAYMHVCARLLHELSLGMLHQVQSGTAPHEAWNNSLVEIAHLSKMHCLFTIVFSFSATLESEVKPRHPQLYPPLYQVEQETRFFLEGGYLSSEQAVMVRQAVRGLLVALRPDAVALVDAFNFSDHSLNSCLGRYDGRVYEALYEFVQREPLNQSPVAPGYEHIRPLIRGELLPLAAGETKANL
ncbi:acylCoA oxidase like protein [Acanthamoeba castellanii str. Neff]|uniref:Acyl-coenzyme A oxidase n=1 Tax=Acanthamoeba castellanii (strain ATCC 30010 / Neff) TaxID=1257118 RepID=L8GRP8_ACACF|nr:acylCoA oxidase like protein [Acanthamoeba castellanii str. Neff]ELR15635.1 acylCoA oxidase like protein [Acanthamoeba castellanii str. Neff]